MFWYLIICVLMLYPFSIVRAGAASDRKTQCIALGFSCFILWFFMAMRGNYVGVDTQYYSYIFTQFADIPITKVFTAETFATASETWSLDFEYGYRLYNKLVSYLSHSQQTITICNSTVIILLLYFLIRKKSPNFMLSIWMYLTLGIFQTEMNVTRNAIAILIVYLALGFWEKKKAVPYILLCLVAASFHKAAFLFIPLYWILSKVRWNMKKMSFAVFASLIVGIGFPYIAPILRSFLPYAVTKYFESSHSKMEAVVVGVFYLLLFMIIYVLMHQGERKKIFEQCHVGTTMFALNLCCFALNFGIGYASRVAALFGPYIILYIPQMLNMVESEKRRREITAIISFVCVCQYFLRMCINNIGGTIPYTFFWQERKEPKMNLVFLFSVILKGIGAVLEVLLQIVITREMGVSGYGDYSTWVNAADLLFWVFFSGLVKCNTFYLSVKGTSIRTFKRRYYIRYVLPLLAVMGVGLLIATGNNFLGFIILITGLELVFYDQSSVLIARGRPNYSLIGEYVLGRAALLVGVFVLKFTGKMSLQSLIWLFMLQFVLVIAFFCLKREKEAGLNDISGEVSVKKWGAYQWSDLMHSMIAQMPVVVQYFFAGAFEAGVVSIVLLVKKLINFISGPTAKIFLPEFSRLYREGTEEDIRKCYASIMRLQMLFVGPLAVLLLAFPAVVLHILAEELIDYVMLFMLCSFVFLLTATLGPCGGILQMTGYEKQDNRCREISLIVMIITMILFRADRLFVLYGLCTQAGFEAVYKYIYVCKSMKKAPVGIITYLKWWILPVAAIAVTYVLGLQQSFLWMVVFAGIVFGITGLVEFKKNNGLAVIMKMRGKK